MGRAIRGRDPTDKDRVVKFTDTALAGVKRIDITPHGDTRGMFARLYCPDEFTRAGIEFTSVQINLSRNTQRHTLRGMHFQDAPFAEAKVVRVVRGSIYDVVLDLRPESVTYRRWTAATLTAEAGNALFIPEGCAHGFLTLVPDTDVLYQMGRPYTSGHARGVRWNDPAFAIAWPADPAVIDDKDRGWDLVSS
jgi:dTDP-4-dehydrorhamnose 3,5-epimerase